MNQEFSTHDLNLASTLVSLGYEVVDLNRTNPKKVQFCFSSADGLEETVRSFWNDSLQLSPQKLFAAQRSLKARLYA